MGSAFARSPVGCQWPVVSAEEDAAEVGASALDGLEALGGLDGLEALSPPLGVALPVGLPVALPGELDTLADPDPDDPVTTPPPAPTTPEPPHPCSKANPIPAAHIRATFRIRRHKFSAPLVSMPEIVPSECMRGKAL
jgi:hypothetical protein